MHPNLMQHMKRFIYKVYDDPRPTITFYETEEPVKMLDLSRANNPDLSRVNNTDQFRASNPDLVNEFFSPTPQEQSEEISLKCPELFRQGTRVETAST